MQFTRHKRNPIIPTTPETFTSVHTANPDVLLFRGRYHLYFRGHGDASRRLDEAAGFVGVSASGGHDQIGVAYADPKGFDGARWEMYAGNPVIRPGTEPEAIDSGHVLDPAAVVLDGRVHLYYTAHSLDPATGSSTGLAVSDDGTHFEKVPGPVVPAIAPEAVVHDGRIYLLCSKPGAGGHFEILAFVSRDGLRFEQASKSAVLRPSGITGAFDRVSVTTVRIWREGEWFYMTYAGCDRYPDYPGAIGLARSRDLLDWERYPGNPIFERGEPGTWDEGALWFPTVEKIGGTYYLWYEGGGAGLGLATPEAREASRRARDENYGGYGTTARSQIGLATYSGKLPAW